MSFSCTWTRTGRANFLDLLFFWTLRDAGEVNPQRNQVIYDLLRSYEYHWSSCCISMLLHFISTKSLGTGFRDAIHLQNHIHLADVNEIPPSIFMQPVRQLLHGFRLELIILDPGTLGKIQVVAGMMLGWCWDLWMLHFKLWPSWMPPFSTTRGGFLKKKISGNLGGSDISPSARNIDLRRKGGQSCLNIHHQKSSLLEVMMP